MFQILFIFVTLSGLSTAIQLQPKFPIFKQSLNNAAIDYKTMYFEQQVDHFGFANQDTFKMRYLYADQHWDSDGGPIFFYCGNEGDIAWFCNNTGSMWEWAPQFKAMIVFAEHRYYGESLPYGKNSYDNISRLGYLSSEQALADFATLIQHIKKTVPGTENSPVIAFGGSYGGMLATWFRMKYPNIVYGSLAASAPIWMFGDLTPCDTFYKIVTADFKNSGENCAENIQKSWAVLDKMGETEDGLKFLSESFKLCKPLKTKVDVGTLKGWLYNTYGNLAMVDYPYPASFLEPLPAWPIKVVCSKIDSTYTSDEHLIRQVVEAVSVYFNYTGTTPCLSIQQQAVTDLGAEGWDFQACSEMVMPLCSTGVNDMFEFNPFNITTFAADCKKSWSVVTRPEWPLTVYAGKDIRDVTNIIFSNGELDPWSGGGVLNDLSDSVIALIIPEAAHHLDLRGSHPGDTVAVQEARETEKTIIQKWIDEYKQQLYLEYVIAQIPLIGNSVFNSSPLWLENTAYVLAGFIMLLCVVSIVLLLKFTKRVFHSHEEYTIIPPTPNTFNVKENYYCFKEKSPLLL